MQLIFADPYYDSEEWKEEKYLTEIKQKLSTFDRELIACDADIGHGADWPCVLVEIFTNVDWKTVLVASATGLFLLGEKINRNIDAWKSIFKKFAALVEKYKPTRIDEKAALVLVINELIKKNYDASSIELSMQIIPFTPGDVQNASKLEAQPDAIYIINAKVNDKAFVYGVKSNCNIEFTHEYSTNWFEF